MHSQDLVKPDGTYLTPYGNRPMPAGVVAASAFAGSRNANPHLRRHPLRRKPMIEATCHRNEPPAPMDGGLPQVEIQLEKTV